MKSGEKEKNCHFHVFWIAQSIAYLLIIYHVRWQRIGRITMLQGFYFVHWLQHCNSSQHCRNSKQKKRDILGTKNLANKQPSNDYTKTHSETIWRMIFKYIPIIMWQKWNGFDLNNLGDVCTFIASFMHFDMQSTNNADKVPILLSINEIQVFISLGFLRNNVTNFV